MIRLFHKHPATVSADGKSSSTRTPRPDRPLRLVPAHPVGGRLRDARRRHLHDTKTVDAADARRPSGKSVLDIGCSEGFFCFEAERRHAARIVGIDRAPHLGEKIALLKEITGSRIEFEDKTVYDLARLAGAPFDLVIFLSVFQHLDHPYLALDLIASATRTTAIMEIPVAVKIADDAAFQRDPQALMRRSAKGRRILLPNESMLGEMLSDAGFVAIDRLARHRPRDVPGYGGAFRQERLILHAHKSAARLV